MKLKIGTGTTVKKKKANERKDDYFAKLSDKELEDMSDEANSVNNLNQNDPDHLKLLKKDEITDSIEDVIKSEIEETVQDEVDNISKEAEEVIKEAEDVKEAVNGVFVMDEVGIETKYATKYATLFPKKRIVYRSFFTKAFLKWYITNVKVSKLKDLFIIESEYIKPEQKEEVMKWITKRMKAPKDDGDIEVPDVLELRNKVDGQMYEFLLSKKWDKKERAKGIIELDGILVEQMRVQDIIMTDALKYLIDAFHLQTKWDNLGKVADLKYVADEMVKEAEFETKTNKDSNAEKGKEIDRSIKRFHHIKFLYELMGSNKFKLIKALNKKEIEHIEKIDSLLNDRVELKQTEPVETKQKTFEESFDG